MLSYLPTVALVVYMLGAMSMAVDAGRIGLRKGSAMCYSLLWPLVVLTGLVLSLRRHE